MSACVALVARAAIDSISLTEPMNSIGSIRAIDLAFVAKDGYLIHPRLEIATYEVLQVEGSASDVA